MKAPWVVVAAAAAWVALATNSGSAPGLHLLACEVVRYTPAKLEFLRWQLPYPGACLCGTRVHAPCFVAQVSGMDITSATFCIGSGYDSRQDRLLWTGNYSHITAAPFHLPTGCLTVTGTNVQLHTWAEALRCAHYYNLATAGRRLSAADAAWGGDVAGNVEGDGESGQGDQVMVAGDNTAPGRQLTAYPGLTTGVRRFTIQLCNRFGECTINRQPALHVTSHRTPPVIRSSATAISYTTQEDFPHGLVVDDHLMCSDRDSHRIAALELRFVLHTYHPDQDQLWCPHPSHLPNGVTCSYNPSTGILRLQGAMTMNQCQWLSGQVRFANTGGASPYRSRRTVFWIAYDEETGDPSSGYQATTHIDVLGCQTHTCPGLVVSGAPVHVPSSATPVFLITYAHILSTHVGHPITQAVIRIAAGYVPGEDMLMGIELPGGLTSIFNPHLGALVIMGAAAAHTYELALLHVLYVNTALGSATTGTRVLTVSVKDSDCWAVDEVLTVHVFNDHGACACLPRFVVHDDITITFRAGFDWTTPPLFSATGMVDVSLMHAGMGSRGPLDPEHSAIHVFLPPAAANCTARYNTTLLRSGVIHFLHNEMAPFRAGEDILILPLPDHLKSIFTVSFEADIGSLVVQARQELEGVPWSVLAEAMTYVRYTNAALLAAVEGMRHLHAYVVLANGCRSLPVFGRIRVLPADLGTWGPPHHYFLDHDREHHHNHLGDGFSGGLDSNVPPNTLSGAAATTIMTGAGWAAAVGVVAAAAAQRL